MPVAVVSPSVRRTLHTVDVENLMLGGPLRTEEVAELHRRYCASVGVGTDAHVVVATSAASSVVDAGLGWGTCRLLFRNGRDGADQALLDVLLTEHVAERYDAVVIGSGDHAFAVAARYLRNLGVHVTVVVANRKSLSNALRKEADRVIVLDQSCPSTFGDAA
jgi:NAD(P)H-hydrate repair Nnr-like enzyme with NAD(P)H-hydrate epimerase domain